MRKKLLSDPISLYVGDMADCAGVDAEWTVVHACRFCFANKFGAPKPGEWTKGEGSALWMNLENRHEPDYAVDQFKGFLTFAKNEMGTRRPMLIHGEKGESRAPMLALLFLAKVLHRIRNETFDQAWVDFEKVSEERFAPAEGLEMWMRDHWRELDLEKPAPTQQTARRAEGQGRAQYDAVMAALPTDPVLRAKAAKEIFRTQPLFHFSLTQILLADHKWGKPNANVLQRQMARVYDWCIRNEQKCRMIVLKPRKVGCSTFSAELCYHHMRRHQSNALILGDVQKRVEGVFQMFSAIHERDSFPWGDSRYESNTLRGKFHYSDGGVGLVQRDTAMDSKVGIGETRTVVWMTEAARYNKTGVVTDKMVISALLNSIPDIPLQLVIAESTAEGQCYDAQTEILTDQGWKFFKDLTGTEAILTKSRETDVAYYQPFWQKQVHPYRGPMVRLKARSVDLLVTPNHHVWTARQKGPMRMVKAESMVGPTTDFQFERSLKWQADGAPDFILPSYTHRQSKGWRTIAEKVIQIDVWLEYLGLWLTDGHVTFIPGNKCSVLTQTKFQERFRDASKNLANAIGCKLRDVPHGSGRRYIIENAQLASYLVNFSKPKRIPRELLMSMTSEQCRSLMNAIVAGDGTQEKYSKRFEQGMIACGIDAAFQDDVQELALKCGYATSAHRPNRNRIATYSARITATLKHNNPPTIQEGFDGLVYCVTLPKDHLLMVRRGGTALWCGNSGWFYETWQNACTIDVVMNGAPKTWNGWFCIFESWFAFPDHHMKRTPRSEIWFQRELDERERRGIALYGWTEQQIAWRRRKIAEDCGGSESKFDEDHPESPEVAFLSSGRPRFNMDGVTRLLKMAQENHDKAERGYMMRHGENVQFVAADGGEAMIWVDERPEIGLEYIAFLDPCTGIQSAGSKDPDAHAPGIVRRGYHDSKKVWHDPKLVACIDLPGGCRYEDDQLAEVMVALMDWYGGCPILIEANKGLGAIAEFQKRGAQVCNRRKFNTMNPGQTLEIPGIDTNEHTRPLFINALGEAIREHRFECNYLPAVQEMRTFVINDRKAEAARGAKDDWILGLSICLFHQDFAQKLMPKHVSWSDAPAHRAALPGGLAASAFS